MNWTDVVWKILIAVAPVIVSVTLKLVLDMFAKMSANNREKVEYWIDVFIKTAQMIEPDPAKRKAWVMDQIARLYPTIDKERLSALIEAVLAGIKLDNGIDWTQLPPNVTPTTPTT